MEILPLTTQLHNQTDQWIVFDVEGGLCQLQDLPPGRSWSVKLSQILQCCRKYGSPNWRIRVMINNEFIGMFLHPRDHLLYLTQIVFKYEPNGQGYYSLCALGTREKGVDYVLRLGVIGDILGKNSNWDKRPWVRIGQADSKWTRSFSEAASSSGIRNRSSTSTSPPRQERFRRRSSNGDRRSIRDDFVINAGKNSTIIDERDQKRVYRTVARKKNDNCVRISLLVLAFTLVVFMHVYSAYRK